MKRLILSLFITISLSLSLSLTLKADSDLSKLQSQNLELKTEIKSLKEQLKNLDEKNYIRIPNKDFENIISSKAVNIIDAKLENKLGNIELLVGFSATIILAIIGFAFNQALTNVRSKIQIDVMEELTEKLNKKLKDVEESFVAEKEQVFHLTEFKALKENNTNYMDKTFSEMQSQKLEELLDKVIKTSDRFTLIPQIVDELVYIYYLNFKTNDIDRLLTEHESDYTFKGPTWVNGALAYTHDYLSYGENFSREQCLRYIEKALIVVPGYGEALALKLYIFMKDYDQAISEEEKAKALDACKSQQKNIINSPGFSAKETLRRIDKDRKIWGKYIDELEQAFPEKMKEMYKIAESYEQGTIENTVAA